MINLEVILTADPSGLARMMCYLCHDCISCPICGSEGPDPSQELCQRKLYSWIMSQEDKEFWKYLKGSE